VNTVQSAQEPFKDGTLYRSAVGKLMYAAVSTRPDISFAVGVASRFMAAPTQEHWSLVKRILRYLRGTQSVGILYKFGRPGQLALSGFCDSDWGGDPTDRKSTAGWVFLLSGGPVSWSSRKQATVALSTTEAEYMSAAEAAKEAIWLRALLSDLGHAQSAATRIFEDNRGCIELSKNPIIHQRSKHIAIRHHFIREKTASGEVYLEHIPTERMVADIFTKPLPRPRFQALRDSLLQSSLTGSSA
jgi:hypothetical protein